MTKEIKVSELINYEGNPMFYITLDNKPLTKINAYVADKVTTDDKKIRLYKGNDEVITFERYIKIE